MGAHLLAYEGRPTSDGRKLTVGALRLAQPLRGFPIPQRVPVIDGQTQIGWITELERNDADGCTAVWAKIDVHLEDRALCADVAEVTTRWEDFDGRPIPPVDVEAAFRLPVPNTVMVFTSARLMGAHVLRSEFFPWKAVPRGGWCHRCGRTDDLARAGLCVRCAPFLGLVNDADLLRANGFTVDE